MTNKASLLDSFVNEFSTAKSRVEKLKEKYTEADFKKRPAEGKWNAGDCLMHITLTNEGYIQNGFNKLAKIEKSVNENKNYKPRFLMGKFINMMSPDNKMKFKAPGKFQAIYNGNLDETVEKFIKTQDDFIELAEKTRKYDLKEKVASPVSSLLKFQFGEMFMAMIEHQKRHLKQAERALQN